MKKVFTLSIINILIIGTIFTLSYSTFGQSNSRFGIRAGANAGTQFGTALIANPKGTLIGFEGALFANVQLTDDIAVCPEIAFTQKGFKVDTSVITSNYIEIPLLLKINMGDGGLYTIIGPYLSYLPTVNVKVPNERGIGWGGTLGLGTKISDHIIIECRYNYNANLWILGTEKANLYGFRNTTISVSLGYLF